MKILDKYLTYQFFSILTGALFFMLGMYIITIYIDNLKYFTNPGVPDSLIVSYIINRIPDIVVQMLPAAALFSTSFIFGNLNSSNEIIALYNGKIGFNRLILPLMVIGMLLSVFSFILFEYVSVESSARAFEIRNTIKTLTGKDLNYMYSKARYFLKGEGNTVYYVDNFVASDAMMYKPDIFRFDSRGMIEFHLHADAGKYDKKDNLWLFSNTAVIRTLPDGKFIRERNDIRKMKLAETPASFMKTPKSLNQMRLQEARDFIDANKRCGGNYRSYLVEYYWRFSFPFSAVITILIGSVAGIYFRKAVLVLSFFLAIIMSFGYYGIMALGLAFGKSGMINPAVAAWTANVIYFAAGVIALMMKK